MKSEMKNEPETIKTELTANALADAGRAMQVLGFTKLEDYIRYAVKKQTRETLATASAAKATPLAC